MKCLIIGNGGREHSLAWKISSSHLLKKLYIARGNGGTDEIAERVDIAPDNVEGLLEFALKEKIDLTVAGPEAPIVMGIADLFRKNGLLIFAPPADAALLEGSKIFAKNLMKKHGIQTAHYETFDDPEKAGKYLDQLTYPAVIKADGLAEGKGVSICENRESAIRVIDQYMIGKKFQKASEKIVIEEFISGTEASYICMTDGETVLPLAGTQDHKRVYDNDRGSNTGGMGAVSPVPFINDSSEKEILDKIIYPVLEGLKENGSGFMGFLYAGLIFNERGIFVLEFNVRAGDPETQPLMMRLKSDLFEILLLCCTGRLEEAEIAWHKSASCCVVMASEGYPGIYVKGKQVHGIEEAEKDLSVKVFHAGTVRASDGRILTNGGRVLGVTALGETMNKAIFRSYNAVGKIRFEGAHFRKDIGQKII
jgi:phosphoribosylamine--glycine ligase